jgi:hypothetical protein
MKRDLKVDIAIGEAPKDTAPAKNEAAVALGRLGGLKGGRVRTDTALASASGHRLPYSLVLPILSTSAPPTLNA